jgi:hypothetical protein
MSLLLFQVGGFRFLDSLLDRENRKNPRFLQQSIVVFVSSFVTKSKTKYTISTTFTSIPYRSRNNRQTTMEKSQKLILLVLTTGWMININSWAFSIHDPTTNTISRKNFLSSVLTAAGAATATTFTVLSPSAVLALDMDAFMEKELQKDTPKQMSDDERMCKFGAPGTERGEACKRAGMSVNAGGSKVDAFGNIDRGNFVRCSTSYPMINGQYVKTVTCM